MAIVLRRTKALRVGAVRLAREQEFFRLHEWACLQAVEIDTARKVPRVKLYGPVPFPLNLVDECSHFSSKQIEDLEPYMRTCRQIIPDQRRGIEGIRIVLQQLKALSLRRIFLMDPGDSPARCVEH